MTTTGNDGDCQSARGLRTRHSPEDRYRLLRKASNLSSGRYRPDALPFAMGVVLARAFSLSARSASRYIWVVSMDSCPSQSAITERSTPACRSSIAAECLLYLWRYSRHYL